MLFMGFPKYTHPSSFSVVEWEYYWIIDIQRKPRKQTKRKEHLFLIKIPAVSQTCGDSRSPETSVVCIIALTTSSKDSSKSQNGAEEGELERQCLGVGSPMACEDLGSDPPPVATNQLCHLSKSPTCLGNCEHHIYLPGFRCGRRDIMQVDTAF